MSRPESSLHLQARAALGEHVPADAREGAFRARMLELLELEQPASRACFMPGHLTASAFVLSPDGADLLLILHKKLGIWIQPGGHVEPADISLEAAARREVAEEVGLTPEAGVVARVFDLDIHAIPAHRAEPAHEHFDVRFCFRAGLRELSTGDEVEGARWVRLEEVASVTRDESVLRAVRKLLALAPAQRGQLGSR